MANLFEHTNVILFLGGLVPPLFWLWFWLQEDNHPEPKYVIAGTFVVGAASAFLALPLEKYAQTVLPSGFVLIFAWSLIEETTKYAATAWSAFSAKSYDEPVDAMVYMITSALGFAALENILFLTKSFAADGITGFLLTTNIRFIGATLLHVVASAFVGAAIAAGFYRSMPARILWVLIGVASASSLHALFNFFILHNEGQNSPAVFILLWASVIATFLFFEAVKRLHPNPRKNETTKITV